MNWLSEESMAVRLDQSNHPCAAPLRGSLGLCKSAILPICQGIPERWPNTNADLGVDLAEVQRFIHGITIGINAVLEGRGAAGPYR